MSGEATKREMDMLNTLIVKVEAFYMRRNWDGPVAADLSEAMRRLSNAERILEGRDQ